MTVKFIAIAALGKNRQIGLDGKLPWSIPDEYEHFKNTIRSQYVLISRKNFELHGLEVAGAIPFILSRKPYSYPNALVFNSMDRVIEHAQETGIEKIYIIGGAEIYHLTLPYISEFLCSIVDYEGPADTYFPEYLFYEWEVLSQKIFQEWTLYHLQKGVTPF